MMQRHLLTVAAVLECLAGLAFMLAPGFTLALLLNAEPPAEALMIGRVAGAALLSLGIACWAARLDPGGPARMGVLRAMTLYNAAAGLVLVGFAATFQGSAVVAWAVGILHLGLALAFAVSLRHSGATL